MRRTATLFALLLVLAALPGYAQGLTPAAEDSLATAQPPQAEIRARVVRASAVEELLGAQYSILVLRVGTLHYPVTCWGRLAQVCANQRRGARVAVRAEIWPDTRSSATLSLVAVSVKGLE